MADLSQTAASVLSSGTPRTQLCLSGEAITQGNSLYQAADKKVHPLDTNAGGDATAVQRQFLGYALETVAGVGQPILVQTDGDINIGATLTVNTVYFGSINAGKTTADLPVSGQNLALIGFAISTTILRLVGVNSPTQTP